MDCAHASAQQSLPRNGPAAVTLSAAAASKPGLIPLQFPGPKRSQEGASVSLPEQVKGPDKL